MKSAVYFFLGLILGAAGGAYVASYISEKKADEQIEKATLEAKEFYKEKYKKEEEKPVKVDPPKDFTRIYGPQYDIYPSAEDHIQEPDINKEHKYITPISGSDYDKEDEYEKCTLDYYADGIAADEMGNDVEDPGSLVGSDTLDDLSVKNPVAYVRNDVTRTVYEICYVDAYYEPENGEDD